MSTNELNRNSLKHGILYRYTQQATKSPKSPGVAPQSDNWMSDAVKHLAAKETRFFSQEQETRNNA